MDRQQPDPNREKIFDGEKLRGMKPGKGKEFRKFINCERGFRAQKELKGTVVFTARGKDRGGQQKCET